MKYFIPVVLAMVVATLYSCHKKDKGPADKFVCDIATADFPATDSAWVFIPNAFTPNGDGLNDGFSPRYHHVQSVEWSVYDQNDQQVFSATDTNAIWWYANVFDGGIQMYHYKIKAVSNNGHTFSKCGNFCMFSCVPAGYNGVDTLIFADQYDPFGPSNYLRGVSQEQFIPCK